MDEILNYDALPWKVYKTSMKAAVVKYAYGQTFIWIEFNDKKIYLYGEDLNDRETIDEMKRLADKGEKLSTFINRNDVRDNYTVRYVWKDGIYKRF